MPGSAVRSSRTLFALAAPMLAAACFDPLFEDTASADVYFVLCCVQGRVDTCGCARGERCDQTLHACAAGRCTLSGNCDVTPDAGPILDAGIDPDGGLPGDGGVVRPATYEPCCVNGRVGTCPCPEGVCSAAAFTPCASSTCVVGGSCR